MSLVRGGKGHVLLNQQPVVPYMRVDHVLLSKGVGLESYNVGSGAGSTLRALTTELST